MHWVSASSVTGTPRQTRKVASGQEKGGWAFVCDEAELGEGETLRVDYQGTILAIARQGEELYAFQEFCTHRFGPLSEGKIQAYQVECPWHRSCFDIRTGKVVEGPAKVDLRTFPVTLRAGKIYIR